jgi:hypothetical protein
MGIEWASATNDRLAIVVKDQPVLAIIAAA